MPFSPPPFPQDVVHFSALHSAQTTREETTVTRAFLRKYMKKKKKLQWIVFFFLCTNTHSYMCCTLIKSRAKADEALPLLLPTHTHRASESGYKPYWLVHRYYANEKVRRVSTLFPDIPLLMVSQPDNEYLTYPLIGHIYIYIQSIVERIMPLVMYCKVSRRQTL